MSKETFEEYVKRMVSVWGDYLDNPLPSSEETWNHQQKKIDELEWEVKNRKAQVHWKCIEIEKLEKRNKALTDQLELLTKCKDDCDYRDDYRFLCRGCKNIEAVKKFKERGE